MRTEHDILLYLRNKPRHGRQQNNQNQSSGNSEFDSRVDKINNLVDSLDKNVPKLTQLSKQIGEVYNTLSDSTAQANLALGTSIGVYEKYAKVIDSGIQRLTWLEERNKELNKALNINSVSAKTFADKLRGLNLQFGDDKLFKFATNINKLTGGFVTSKKLVDEQLGTQAKFQSYMIENLGLSEDAANSYALYAAGVGKTTEEAIVQQNQLAKVLADNTGIDQLTAQTMITQEIAGLSSDIRQQYAGLPGELETAVLKSKLLGVSLQKLHDIGKATLDIESAVGNEIEMQLLSGRKLEVQGGKNFMAEYRKATLMSDSNRQQELLQEMLTKEGDALKKNFMYREKMASALGMTGDELMKTVEKQQFLQEAGLTELKNLSFDQIQDQFADLSKKYGKEKIDELLKKSDKRTYSEQQLESIASDISKLVKDGSAGINIESSQAAAGKFADAVKPFADQFTTSEFHKAAANIDAFGIAVSSTITPISELGKNLPLVGDALQKINEKLSKFTSGLPIGTTGVGGAIVTKEAVQDAILFDPQDEVMTVASTDRGQLENTVNNMMTGNVTNNTNVKIDYNAMANAIASAMAKTKLTINQSLDYSNSFNIT